MPNPSYILQLVALSILLTLSGCGLFGGSSLEPQEPVELTYVSLLEDAESNNAENQLIEQFQGEYPHITVKRSQYQRSPQSYLTATPPPDLMVLIADANTFEAIEAGLALDISQVWRDKDLAEAYPVGFRTFGEREGRQYFLPVAHTWVAFYYNRATFERQGLTPPETWEQLLTVAETLWLNGVTPFTVDRNDTWSVSMWFEYLSLRLHGAEFYEDLVRGEIPYDDFRVLEVFEAWRDLLEAGYFGESSAIGTGQNFGRVIEGEAAMILSSPVLMQDLPDAWREQMDFFPFPMIDPALPVTEVAPSFGYLVPAQTTNPAEATQFLAFMSTAEIQTAMTQQLGSNFGVVAIHNGVDPANFAPASQQGVTLIRAADTIVRPFIFSAPEAMLRRADSAFRQFILDPTKLDDSIDILEAARRQAYDAD